MFAKLTLLFAIAGYAYGLDCLSIAGPSLSGFCPEGSVDKSGVCCIIDPALNCQDKEEWCPAHANACNDTDAGPAMRVTCPYTCAACNSTNPYTVSPAVSTVRPSETCVDKINPVTGVSDCPKDKNLCTNEIYKPLMRQQCPKTCGFC